jgi:beta-glucosidase
MDRTLESLLDELSLDDKARITAGRNLTMAEGLPAIGLEAIRMVDGPMGVTSGRVDERDVSLLMPCGTALAASWDRELVEQVGQQIAEDALRRDVDMVLGPNLNLPRSPLFGRAFETYSEDPWLTSVIGACWIAGLQSRGVGAVAKHVVGNDSETQRHAMNAVIDEQALREVYLLPFEVAARAGAWGLLMAYNRVNGIPNVEQRAIIADIIKGEWGYDGLVMSDWFATHDTLRSALAGLDLEMPGPPRHFGAALAAAVREGQVDEARLDDAAERYLRMAARVGRLGTPKPDTQAERIAEPKALLRRAAAAGFVLLKNDGNLLPATIAPGARIVVIGPNALLPSYQGATFAKIALGPDVATPIDAIRARFGATHEVLFELGVPLEYRLPPLTLLDVRAAHDGDARGWSVDFFEGHDFAGDPLAHEVRHGSTMVWFGDMPGGLSTSRPGSIRASTILTPEMDGTYRLFYGGTGTVRLLADGREVGVRPSQVEGGDVMGPLLRGDADMIEYPLAAGVPVRLDFEMRFEPARAQGIWFGGKAPELSGHLERAVQAAASADLVVLVVGETSESGVESRDRTTTKLPENQVELIRSVCAANRDTVVVINAAHAVDMPWAEVAGTVLCAWFPGQEFGPALAAILDGELEPSGRLPVTFAMDEADYPAFDLTPDANVDLRYAESTAIGYRHFDKQGIAPRFPLGHGLGYADFAYDAVTTEQRPDGSVLVHVTVRNTAGRAGKEVVQVYLAGTAVDFVELKGFATLTLAPGATESVSIELEPRAFAHWSVEEHAWRVTPGDCEIRIGRSAGDIRFTERVQLAGRVLE